MKRKICGNYILNILLTLMLALAAVTASAGCGGGGSENPKQTAAPSSPSGENESAPADTHYEIPEFKEAYFDWAAVEGNEEVMLDVSRTAEGYFGVYSDSDARLKLQVIFGEETYTYDLVPEETDMFPFQCGNGQYKIRVMKNIEDKKYFELYAVTADVTLENEFAPYLVAGQYCDYTPESECVKEASRLAGNAANVTDFISKVYERVCQNVTYDYDKAETVVSGYIPDPDETLATGKGICFDYACLAASMLRSQGVPTKIIFGYVAPDDLYHAWNMYYVEGEGWITVEIKADPYNWNRLDLTFSANGSNAKFIGDGTNYTDIYQY